LAIPYQKPKKKRKQNSAEFIKKALLTGGLY
jgi:hypothetical protein